MKLSIFLVLLVAGLCAGAPTSAEDDDSPVIVNTEFFPDEFKVYTAEHDIVNVLVPINDINFAEDEGSSEDDDNIVLFFVQADIKQNGQKEYKGLYKLDNKKANEILPNGRDAAAGNDNSKTAFFAADDGVYIYDHTNASTTKYGTFDKSCFAIAKINGSDALYVLTDDKELYKISNAGSEIKKITEVQNAEQIVLDYDNNLYFFSADKKPYVYNGETVKKIEGLPESPSYAALLKPPFVLEKSVPYIADNQSYIIYSNGRSEVSDFQFKVHPSAYAMEGTLIQYAAYDKKLYEYNVLLMILGQAFDQMKNFFEDKKDSIQTIATRSRSNFGAKA